jgi:alkanesulfonate monooxygenase SsuD/methylene tetrahydromethanopterin reductase-like flavin-dependent oxidoreductase (luciferase family)
LGLKFCATYPYFYPDVNRPYYEVVDECVEIAQAAEDLGFESISLPEHHFFNYICNLGCFAPHGDLERVMDEFNRTVASSGKPRGDVMESGAKTEVAVGV